MNLASSKRGQVTIFILVAVLLVSGIGLAFYSKQSANPEPIVPDSPAAVYNAIYSCIEKTGDDAVLVTLMQGGIYEERSYDTFQIYKLAKPKPFSGENATREIEKNPDYEFSREGIRESVDTFFNDAFKGCLNEINFSKFGENLTIDDFTMNAEVYDKLIYMNLYMPVTIIWGNDTTYKDSFQYAKKINMDYMEDVVNKIVDKSVETNFPPYDEIEQLEKDYDVKIYAEFVFEDDAIENVIYSIKFNDDRLVINFNINYNWYDR